MYTYMYMYIYIYIYIGLRQAGRERLRGRRQAAERPLQPRGRARQLLALAPGVKN